MNDKVKDLSYIEMQEIIDTAWNYALLYGEGRSHLEAAIHQALEVYQNLANNCEEMQ